MTTVTVYGSSDDLIEVDGDIREEFYLKDDEEGDLIAFSNGTVLRVKYTNQGIWRVTPVILNAQNDVNIDAAPEEEGDDGNYSDRATVTGDFTWVVHGLGYASAK